MSKENSESLDASELRKMFKSLKNVELLGNFRIDKFRGKAPLMVYRYMHYARAKALIESKKISFADPKIWEDPFEKRFACGKYEGFSPKQLACLCVTTEHGENEAAFWRGFDPDGKCHKWCYSALSISLISWILYSFCTCKISRMTVMRS